MQLCRASSIQVNSKEAYTSPLTDDTVEGGATKLKHELPKFLRELNPGIFLSDNYVVLDFEVDTSGGAYGSAVRPDNHVILACWRLGPGHVNYFEDAGEPATHAAWGSEFDLGELIEHIERADFVVAHSAKYELGWLRRAGVDLRTILPFDTMLAEYVLMGNLAAGDDFLPPRSLSLDSCSRRRGLPIKDPVVDLMISHGINPKDIPRPWLEGRCRQDVETTEAVFLDQRKALQQSNRLSVLYTRCLLAPVLADIEFEGMALDPSRVENTYADYRTQYLQLDAQMNALTGGINWNSPAQVAKFLYDELGFDELRDRSGNPKRNPGPEFTKTGKPTEKRKADKDTVDALLTQATTDRQREFVAIRKKLGKVNAALSKNLEFFVGVVREYEGVFHATFNQANTATHRLSCSGIPIPFKLFDDKEKSVQLQNSPRAFKKLYRAKRAGWLIYEPDGSMLEFRVAAELGNDRQAKADIADITWDAHITSGSAMAALPYDEVDQGWKSGVKKYDEIRQQAKPETFKPLYGGERGTEEQERWYKQFRVRYADLAKTQESWVEQVMLSPQKELITAWGMRFYWPHAQQSRYGRVNVKNAIYNYPVQSLATAEIIPIAVVFFWHRLRERDLHTKCFIINTVHDSVPSEVHPEALGEVKEVAKQAFTHDVYRYLRVVYGMDFRTPLGIGSKAGEFWGEGKEESIDVYPDGTEVRRK